MERYPSTLMGARLLGMSPRSWALATALGLIFLSSCDDSKSEKKAPEESPSEARTAVSETRDALRVVRTAGTPLAWGAGDGSLLLSYETARRCYYRHVDPSGVITGFFKPTCTSYAVGLPNGFLVPASWRFGASVDVSDPLQHEKIVWDEHLRPLESGDVALGSCADIWDPESVSLEGDPELCAYSPGQHTVYSPDLTTLSGSVSNLSIDPEGRLWAVTAYNVVARSEISWRGPTWSHHEFSGADVDGFVRGPFSNGKTVAVGFEGWRSTRVEVSNDAGDTWHEVTGLPKEAQESHSLQSMADGRLLVGPVHGRLWRTPQSSSTSFAELDAGPITSVVVAGDLVYGLNENSRRWRGMVWVSADGGSTWKAFLEPAGRADPSTVPVAAEQLSGGAPLDPSDIIRRGDADGFAIASDGSFIITYGVPTDDGEGEHAWRQFDSDGHFVSEGAEGSGVQSAGAGFLIRGGETGLQYVGPDGRTVEVDERYERRSVASGDIFVNGWMYRPGTHETFRGKADPDGVVTAVDGHGKLWALGKRGGGRTTVRSALPGEAWTSRDIGPAIGARSVVAEGSTLVVGGWQTALISSDYGATWTQVVHGAAAYTGVPVFRVWPDGTIVGGEDRGREVISTDHRTFRSTSLGDSYTVGVDGLLLRLQDQGVMISGDGGDTWEPLTPDAVRRLSDR
jgi:hypothetical protein